MAYHISNLGAFGEPVRIYADQHGFVPQAGDQPQSFVYEGGGDGDWEAWVAEAVAASEQAETDLAAWQRPVSAAPMLTTEYGER